MANKIEKKESAAEETVPVKKVSGSGHSPVKILGLILVLGAGWAIYKNPQLIERAKVLLAESAAQYSDGLPENQPSGIDVQDLQNQIAMLRTELFNLKSALPAAGEPVDVQKLNELYDKFDAIEKTNMNVINSKADASAVLGLAVRLDEAENKLKLVSRATDENALVLTAAMMVKEASGRGGNFVYEAEVLQQLAQNNPRLAEPLAVIAKTAPSGIVTNARLINEFESIYGAILKKQKDAAAQTWKDRILNKLSDFVKVRKVNEAEEAEMQILQNLKNIRDLVREESFVQAAEELRRPENEVLLEDAGLRKWQEKALAKVYFEQAVGRISTYSLAAMKVNAIKKETME